MNSSVRGLTVTRRHSHNWPQHLRSHRALWVMSNAAPPSKGSESEAARGSQRGDWPVMRVFSRITEQGRADSSPQPPPQGLEDTVARGHSLPAAAQGLSCPQQRLRLPEGSPSSSEHAQGTPPGPLRPECACCPPARLHRSAPSTLMNLYPLFQTQIEALVHSPTRHPHSHSPSDPSVRI